MRIAILGSTSQIARDLIRQFANSNDYELVLFARQPEIVVTWLKTVGIAKGLVVSGYADFTTAQRFDAVINFVGIGNPARVAAMGASIFDVTLRYDELGMVYVREHPFCRYIFLSSGAVYGSKFDEPVAENTMASFPINNVQPQDWYGLAKMYAEARHRALSHLPIVDLRVFNYFSYSTDIEARFLITDVLRAIRDQQVMQTSHQNIVRDYVGPKEIADLIQKVLRAPPSNVAIDCFTLNPVDKISMLERMRSEFGLKYELVTTQTGVLATGSKIHYYSKSRKANELFGYKPETTAIEIVVQQSRQMLTVSDQYNSITATLSNL